MLIYAGTSPEDEIPDASNLFIIVADLTLSNGDEIYFFFDDLETFLEAGSSLELGSWSGFEVVPHSRIMLYPNSPEMR